MVNYGGKCQTKIKFVSFIIKLGCILMKCKHLLTFINYSNIKFKMKIKLMQ